MNKRLLKEARKHGTPIYPVSLYEITCAPDAPLLDLHWHDELELLLVTEGRAVFRVDAQDYELSAGEAIFVNSGQLHSGTVVGDEPCSFAAVVFHAGLFGNGTVDRLFDHYIAPIVRDTFDIPVRIARGAPDSDGLLDRLAQLVEADRDKRTASELEIKGLLFACVASLLRLSEPKHARKENDGLRIERLKPVIAHIEQRYAEPITLSRLAGIAGMSESYFCRYFKRITAKSPIEYMNGYRAQRAADRLRQSDDLIMDIAMDAGFNNLSYFNVVFRQRYGCTPGQYRRRITRAES
ncbi:helix-turn-helix domain-containing protein [Cohnella sp. GCM10027633]|uniref:helix-turn-helix transcriptional regulator n=1 Tax=unclassified Cohnella TaxID=2636738 RepID=UPI0036253D53